MNRTFTNLIVDVSAAVLLIGMLATGWILKFPLPPGTNKTLVLWGLSRHQWGEVHTWISIGLLAVLAIHVILHWQWISSVIAKRLKVKCDTPSNRRRWGAISLVLFLLSFSAFAWATYRGVATNASTEGLKVTDNVRPDRQDVAAEALSTIIDRPSEQQGRVNFWRDVYPILDRSCASCHCQQQAKAGFRIDLVADYFGTKGKPAIIVRGKADESLLIAIVSGTKQDMPLAAKHQLPEPDVTLIKNWISEGAKLTDDHN